MEVASEIDDAIYEAVTAGSLRAAARQHPTYAQNWTEAADAASDRAATLVARFLLEWSRKGAQAG